MKEPFIPVFFDTESAASTQYRETIQGIRSAAARAGAHIKPVSEKELDTFHPDEAPDVCIATGTLMPFLRSVIDMLRRTGRLVVLAGLDSEQFGDDVSCATPSRRAETQQLVNYLFRLGRKRIALVGFGANSINDTFRYHAAMSAAAALGLSVGESDAWLWQRDLQSALSSFIPCAERYDAVICPNDVIAIRFISQCKKSGLRVPEDLYTASFGNMYIGRYCRPGITTMTMDMTRVGEQAFAAWQFLSGSSPRPAAIKITVPSILLVRESTACRTQEGDLPAISGDLPADCFYADPSVAALVRMENCLSLRDGLDMRILHFLLDGTSYEKIADTLFISGSTLRYRLGKIFAEAGVKGRAAFSAMVREHLGEENPF